jgi:peroxiredoxin
MSRRLGAWLVAAGVVAAALAAVFTSPSPPPPVGRGSRAPDFQLPQLGDGAPIDLADLGGKVVLLNFWATWCKPCEDEMPAMQRLYQTLAGTDFELLAVSVDDDPGEVRDFAQRLGLHFPILLDPDEKVAHAFQTYRYPETLLIGRDGVVVERFIGPREWDAGPYLARIQGMLERGGSSGGA